MDSSKRNIMYNYTLNPIFSSNNKPFSSPKDGYSSYVFAQSPLEPPRGKIEMYSKEFYAACGVGGALGCGLTHTAMTPLDVVKCNMQIDPTKYKSTMSGFNILFKEQGLKGFFKGWSPTLLGYSMQGAGKMGFYEFFKKYYSDMAGPEYAAKYKTLIYLAGSASAEVIADVALCPMEAVKVRVQTQPGFARGLQDGLPKIVRAEGFAGLYKGQVPLWGRQIPYTMMKFASFENIVELIYKKAIPVPKEECSKPLQLGISFAGGYIAGIFCALISHPADNLVSFLNNSKGATVGDAVKNLGLLGLFTRGLPIRIVMIGTLTGAQWGIYDAFKVSVGLPTTGGITPDVAIKTKELCQENPINIPYVHLHEKRENKDRWHGAEIHVIIEGNWTTHRSKILQYMRQMAVITPYAEFLVKFISDTSEKNMTIRFARRTDVMPPVPLETKYHPSAVDLLLIKRLISETSKQNLQQFLQHEFLNISKSHAERLIGEMGPDFGPKMALKSLTAQQIVRIHQLFREARFDDPSGDCLSPAGEYNLRLGIIKELQPDLVATYAGSPRVFEGHPFMVEAGVSLGGKDVKQGINIFRFANRIPLLFEQGADVITRTALKRINWSSYKINQGQDKIGVFVSIVSTKIPFKGTGKEYIGDDITEIASAVQAAIKQCCSQLKSKIVKKLQARERQERKRNLNRYIPDACRAVMEVIEQIANEGRGSKRHKKYEKEDEDLIEKVASEQVTDVTLRDCLTQHVEQVDYEMALEYATQSGVSEEPREDIYLNSLDGSYNFTEFHSPVFVFRLVS